MKALKFILPAVAVLAGIAGLVALKAAQVQVQTQTPEKPLQKVAVVAVKAQDYRYHVMTNGSVAPRTETALTTETAGRVVSVHPNFHDGGFFKAKELLVQIDDTTQKALLAQAEAALAGARAALQREEAEAALAKKEWEKYGKGEPDALVLHEPQLAERKAAVLSAQASVDKAANDLERTKLIAPYDGRIRAKLVEEGQYVGPGTPVARIYATDFAEVRLPVSADEIGYLHLPLGRDLDFDDESAPEVTLSAQLGGERIEWPARITRTEAQVDPQTRMYYAVARVKNPYDAGRATPLLPNTFVDAKITGREAQQVFVLPRRALRPDGKLMLVDKQNRLKFREVKVVRTTPETVVVGTGLEDGERVITSEPQVIIEDMPVQVEGGRKS